MALYQLDHATGYFQRDGQRFIPVGVNYWLAASGVEMWQRWLPWYRTMLDLAAADDV